jgi:hypothetical protein
LSSSFSSYPYIRTITFKLPEGGLFIYSDTIFSGDWSNKYVNFPRRDLPQFQSLKYSFDILHDFIMEFKSDKEYTIKIDCDLTFYDKIPNIDDDNKDILVWKYERMLFEGDPRMGEIKSSTLSVGDVNYKIFNIGLLGLPASFETNELDSVYRKMVDVDITDVSDLNVKSWHCAEQTAKNWLFHKHNYNVKETYNIVDHNFSVKKKCIDDAKYLLKQ